MDANGIGWIHVNPTFVISRCRRRWNFLKPPLSSSRSSTMLSSEVATPPGKAASMEAKPASVKLDPAFNQLISSHFLVQIAGCWEKNTAPYRASCSLWAITWNMRPFSGATLAANIPWMLCPPVMFAKAPVTLTRSRSKPEKIVLKTGMLGEALQDSHEKHKLVNQPLVRIDWWRLYLSRLCTLNLEQQGSMNLEVDKSSIDIQTSLNLGLALLMT